MQIKNTQDIQPTKINCLIVGESGSGKTTLAGTLHGKTLVVSLESGLLSLRNKKVDYIEIEGASGVEKINHLRNILPEIISSDYDNIYFDSLSDIAQCFVEYAKKEYPDDRQTMKMFGYYGEMITKFIKYTRDMNKNVFYTVLQKVTTDDVGRRFVMPDMMGAISHKANAMFDFVFNLRSFEKDGEKVRALLTSSTDNYVCKDRSGKLDEYEKPDLQAIIDKAFS